ncbi:MAG: hypothetical protein P8130_04195, partial [Deltaproteobacteria bacterium]
PDYAAGQILGDVLDSQRARLYDLVTEGAALSAGFSEEERKPATVGYVIAAFPKGGNGRDLVSRLKKIVDDYRNKGVPADLVKAAKAQEIAAAEFAKNSTDGLAFAWAEAVAVEGRHSPEDDIDAIRRVTVADVNRVARQCLVEKTAISAVLTPKAAGRPVAVTGLKRKEAFAPKEVKPVALPSWAKGLKVLKVPAAPPAPRDFRLDNGLRLLVLPSDVSPTVSLYGAVRNRSSMQEPVGKEGVASVLAELFSYGTTSLNRLAGSLIRRLWTILPPVLRPVPTFPCRLWPTSSRRVWPCWPTTCSILLCRHPLLPWSRRSRPHPWPENSRVRTITPSVPCSPRCSHLAIQLFGKPLRQRCSP